MKNIWKIDIYYLVIVYIICFLLVILQLQTQTPNTENNSNFVDPHLSIGAHTEELQQTGQAYFRP